MILPAFVAVVLAWVAAQSQAPPTPPASPFAGAAIRRTPPAGEGTPVRLTFAWPVGMAATIEVERSKTTVSPQGRSTTTAAMRYRMRVAAHADGRLIEYDNFEPIGVQLAAGEQAAFVEVLSALMPSLIVDNTGEFVRVGDLTSIRAAMRQITDTARVKAPAGSVPPNLQEMLDSLSTDAVLSKLAAAEWQHFAGAFVGFEGRVGEMLAYDSEEPSPVLPGILVPMRTTFGALRREPCAAELAPDGCVVMQVRSVVAPGGMQLILKRLLEGMKDLEGVTYDRFDATTDVLTTLEPATMRPYRITHTKTVDFSVTAAGKGTFNATATERRVYRITYTTR